MTGNAGVESDDNMVSSSSSSESGSPIAAASLVSPNTERAVEEIIRSEQQHQQQQQQHQQSVATVSTGAGSVTAASTSNGAVSGGSGATIASDNLENLQRAVQILARAKQLDEIKRYDEALKLYRQGVDMLLEELMIRQGTDQSRTYLRDKCNVFMNRIDQLKLIIQIEKASADNKENQSQINA